QTPVHDRIYRARGTTPDRLHKRLKGDLDNVVLMALRKEPERRYSSARRLADDIESYLAHRPVVARPNTPGYVLARYLRRHRAAAGIGATAIVAILSVVAFYTWQVAQQRDRARDEAQKATRTAEFLRDLFQVVNPERTAGDRITARTLLDHGARRLARSLSDERTSG
ncbi:MAG: hypothetical protein AAFU65_18845, partial [Pseudomonadota bacterium]